MELAIVVFDQFTDIDVFLSWDIANRVRDRDLRVRLLGTAPRHTSLAGLAVPVHGSIDDAARADGVIVASGPATRRLADDPAYLRRLRLDPGRQKIGSMCSGALVLAALGLLDGKRATTYPTTVDLLAARGVTVVDEPFVVEGNVATAAACLAGIDLVGWMIAGLFDEATRDAALAEIAPVGRARATLTAP